MDVWPSAGRTAPTVRPVANAALFFRNPRRLRRFKSTVLSLADPSIPEGKAIVSPVFSPVNYGTSAEIRALDAVVQRCVAKDARDRYGSAAELAKDLVPTLARCGGFDARHGLTMSDSPTPGERTRL